MGAIDENAHIWRTRHRGPSGDPRPSLYGLRVHRGDIDQDTTCHDIDPGLMEGQLIPAAQAGWLDFVAAMDGLAAGTPLAAWWAPLSHPARLAVWWTVREGPLPPL